MFIINGSIIAIIDNRRNKKTQRVSQAQACSSVISGKNGNLPCIISEKNM